MLPEKMHQVKVDGGGRRQGKAALTRARFLSIILPVFLKNNAR